MPHRAHKTLGQLKVSSNQLEIDMGQALHIPRANRCFKLCGEESESEKQFMCLEIKQKYATLFAGDTTLQQMMENNMPTHFGRGFLKLQKHRESTLMLR